MHVLFCRFSMTLIIREANLFTRFRAVLLLISVEKLVFPCQERLSALTRKESVKTAGGAYNK